MAAKKDSGNSGFYLMQDGTYADPSTVKADKAGVMKNEQGVGVAMKPDGSPMTMADSSEHNRKAAEAGKEAPAEAEEK